MKADDLKSDLEIHFFTTAFTDEDEIKEIKTILKTHNELVKLEIAKSITALRSYKRAMKGM